MSLLHWTLNSSTPIRPTRPTRPILWLRHLWRSVSTLMEPSDADLTTAPGDRTLGRWDDWARWLIGGIVAGAIAWGGIGARMATLETRLAIGEERNAEDRKLMRETIDGLRNDLYRLREQLIRQDAIGHTNGDRR